MYPLRMAVFIELTTSPAASLAKKVGAAGASARAGLSRVRRPLRGIEIKEDTYATLRVVASDGSEIQVLDSSSRTGKSTAYSNFILQTVQDARMERHQFIETFGETYLFLFGESPHMLNIQAMVLNTHDFNWKAEFLENYKRYFRGTRCIEMGARCYLSYDDVVIEGYILNATTVDSTGDPYLVPLSFQFFVCEEQNISFVGNPQFPLHSSAFLPDGVSITEPLNGEQIQQIVEQAALTDPGVNQNAQWNVQGPLRQLIADNYDEYTKPDYATLSEIVEAGIDKAAGDALSELDSLEKAMKQSLDELNALAEGADERNGFWDDLGVGPYFNNKGATFGASPTPGQLFKGVKNGASALAKATKSALSGDFKGAKDELGNAANAVDSGLGGPFGSLFEKAEDTYDDAVGTGKKAVKAVKSGAKDAIQEVKKAKDALSNAVSKGKDGMTAVALAVLHPTAALGMAGEAYDAARKAAEAGGYSTSQSYLGSTSQNSPGVAQSNSTASGPNVVVKGASSSFGLVPAEGSLETQEESSTQPSSSWHKTWSWPSTEQKEEALCLAQRRSDCVYVSSLRVWRSLASQRTFRPRLTPRWWPLSRSRRSTTSTTSCPGRSSTPSSSTILITVR